MKENKRFICVYSAIIFFVLLIFSVLYAKERIIYTDSGNYLFFAIQSKSFFIAHNRFIAYLFEIPLVIGIKNHLSLQTITVLYSIGYFIPDLIVLSVLVMVFKDYTKTLMLVLLWIVGNNYDFFYTASEFHKGIYFSLLFWCFLEKYLVRRNKGILSILFSLMIILIWSHPLIIFPLTFVLIYVYIKDEQFQQNKRYYGIIISLFFFLIVFKLYFFNSNHENGKYGFISGIIDSFPYYKTRLFDTFFGYSFAHQLSFLGLISINIFVLARQQKKAILVLYLSFLIGYWFLITASFYTNTYDFYIEHLYKPIIFFTVAVFSAEVIPVIKKEVSVFLLITVAIYGILKIEHTSKFYKMNQKQVLDILYVMESHHIQKAYMQANNYKLMLNDDRWNSSVISLLLSSYESSTQTKTIAIEYNYEQVGAEMKDDKTNLYNGYKVNIDDLNKDYFFLSNQNSYIKIDSLIKNKQ